MRARNDKTGVGRKDAPEEEESEQDVQQPLAQENQSWQQQLTGATIGKASVHIKSQDLSLLRPGECLNDNLVVGGAILIAGEGRSLQRSVYAFESHFLSRSLSMGTFDHKTVERWRKQVDVFQYDYVLFPICQNHHWYFVVVCHLASWRARQKTSGDLDGSPSRLESSDAVEPMLLILDPLGQQRPGVCYILKQYLKREAQVKDGLLLQDCDIGTVVAGCLALQSNGHDCGMNTLAYWELFCQSPAEYVRHTIQHQRSSRDLVSSKPCTRIRLDARQRLHNFLRRQYNRQASGQWLKLPSRQGLLVKASPVEALAHLRSSPFGSLTTKAVAVPGDLRSLDRVCVQHGSRSDRELDGVPWHLHVERLGCAIRRFVDAYLEHPLHMVESLKLQALADIECLDAALFGKDKNGCRALDMYSPPVRDYIQMCAYLSTAVMLMPRECASSLGPEIKQSQAQPVLLTQNTGDPFAQETGTFNGPESSRAAIDPPCDTLVYRFWNLLSHLHLAGTSARPGQPRRGLRALLEQAFHCGYILHDALATNPEYRLVFPSRGECFEKTTMAEICTGQTGGELVALCLRPGVHNASSQVVVRPVVVTMQIHRYDTAVERFPDNTSDARVKWSKDIKSDTSEGRLGGNFVNARNGTHLKKASVAREDVQSSQRSPADLTKVGCMASPPDQNQKDDPVSAVDVRKSPRIQQVEPNRREPWILESALNRKRLFSDANATQLSLDQPTKFTT